jgi:hypothetical protein
MNAMDSVDHFVDIFKNTYNTLMGEERKIDEPVIRALACAVVDLLDQQKLDTSKNSNVHINTSHDHHYHPQSGQKLHAVNGVVVIEHDYSLEKHLAATDVSTVSEADLDAQFARSRDVVFDKAGKVYTVVDPKVAVFDKDGREVDKKFVPYHEEIVDGVLISPPFRLYEDGRLKDTALFVSIEDAQKFVSKMDGAMDVVDASLGDYRLVDRNYKVVWTRPARRE